MDINKTFQTVASHLLKQNRRALCPDKGYCKYRAKNEAGETLKCAVGCLIPDDLYDPSFEGLSIRTAPELELEPIRSRLQRLNDAVGIETDKDREFLAGLQRIHDGYPPESWPTLLRFYAETHRISLEFWPKELFYAVGCT